MRKDTYIWHADSERAAKETLTEALMAYEAKYPYRYGMKKAEIQMTYFQKMKPNVFDRIVDRLVEAGTVKRWMNSYVLRFMRCERMRFMRRFPDFYLEDLRMPDMILSVIQRLMAKERSRESWTISDILLQNAG